MTPKYGNTMMYTSGWPKNQNRCCHRIGEPPPRVEDVGAEVPVGEQHGQRGGEHRERHQHQQLVTSMFQVNIGMRNIVMPGARSMKTVAMMLTPVSTPDSARDARGP